MPTISEIIDQKDKKGKFTKKEYRPWNLSETLSSRNAKQDIIEQVVGVVESVQEQVEVEPTQEQQAVEEQVVNAKPAQTIQKIKIPEKELSETNVKIESSTEKLAATYTKPKEISPKDTYSKSDLSVSSEDLLIQLSGRQRELFIIILRNLIDHNSLVTLPMYSQNLIESINTTLGTIKNAVRRLEAKGLIKSVSKRARGGHFRFEVKEEIISIGQRLFFRP